MPEQNKTQELLHSNCLFPRISYALTSLRVLFLICALVCTLAFTFLGGAPLAYADSTPGGKVSDPVVRAVDIAKPAVVRIITVVNSRLIVSFMTQGGQTTNVTFPQSSASYQLALSGSGTFISSHGDILTADHVVNPPKDKELSQYLDEQAGQDVTDYINQHSQPNSQQITKDQVVQALEAGQLPSQPQYGDTSSEVYLSTEYTGPLNASNIRSLPPETHAKVDKIEQQSAVDQKDVAIIHTPLNDMASVQLGNSSSVQTQDELTIIGFPGNADVSRNPSDLLTPSINKVIVSSIKTTDNGAPVIQVGGNVEHGDSGGPALDSNGNVVGIVSFGIANSPGSTSFLQASNSARDLVQVSGLDTIPGAFQKQWNQAFLDYASTSGGHWHKAQQEFEQLKTKYPQFKAIAPYLTYTQSQAQNEQLPASRTGSSPNNPLSSVPLATLVWTIIALAVIVLLIILLFAVALGRRGKKRTPVPTGATQFTPPAQPAQSIPTAQSIAESSQRQASQVGYNNNFGGLRASNAPGNVPPVPPAAPPYDTSLSAFGAPPPQGAQSYSSTPTQSAQPLQATQSAQQAGTPSDVLRSWPCGHMNRSSARFCSVCGEPAPPSTQSSTFARRVEQ